MTNFLAACCLACFLAACGGGGTNDGCQNIDPSRPGALPGCGGSTTSPGGGTSSASLALDMQDPSGAAFNNVTPDAPATLKVVLKNAGGTPVANSVVSFTTSDSTGVFSPGTGTALTDSNGAASVKLAAGSQAGAFTVTASALAGTATVKASKNYTVSFPVLTMSELQLTPASLPAGGNASVTVSIMNGANAYAQPVSVEFTSPCAAAGKASIGSPVTTRNGVATASYTDKGCSSNDTITATAKVPNATLSKSASIAIQPSIAGSLTFMEVSTSNIALRGTGGPGRPESSVIKFKVLDRNGNPVAGRTVNFAFTDTGTATTTGGMSLFPSSATTAADGTASATAYSGTIPTSIRVTATTSGELAMLTSVSSVLVVSSGVPDEKHFTMGITTGNCEGWDINKVCGIVEVILGDHFSNQVPDGTVVNFTAEGGVIEDSCQTVRGLCRVNFYSANPRPADGQVTILGYVIGEETFVDANGNNVYDPGEPFSDLSPDIYRDDNEDGKWSPGEPCISVRPSANCNAPGDGIYNGVLRVPQTPSNQTLYVSRAMVAQFSTSDAIITISNSTLTCTPGAIIEALVKITDLNGNWMPAASTITFAAIFGQTNALVSPASDKVPNVVLGVGEPLAIPTYSVSIPCPSPDIEGTFVVTVTPPLGKPTVVKKPIL